MSRWWLSMRVHGDALLSAPLAYLTAAWWRIIGKRVRARAQMAPLLGRSKHAYLLWLMTESPGTSVSEDPETGADTASIIALIDIAGKAQPLIDQTLASLAAERIEALVVGSADLPDASAAAAAIHRRGRVWLMPIVAGDTLHKGAARAYQNACSDGADLIYADDDIVNGQGLRHSPHFKPDWNAELFRHFDYLTGACIIPNSPDVLASGTGPGWASRMIATAVGTGKAPVHIPEILHHRRGRILPAPPPALAVKSSTLPTVTVIVPTRNRVDLLRTCLTGLERTDYPELDIIVVDNGSDDPATLAYLEALPGNMRVLHQPGPFNFSALNNRAAKCAQGQILCLLNNDIEIMAPDWLKIMAAQALRDDVGAVGARLLYPDGRIQHAGVVTGVGGGAAHAHRLLHPHDEGYFRRHALPQFVSAVTAACLVVQRERFAAVGGLNETHFAVAFNDVDLCLRLNQRGWQTLYEPRATLVHHESVSRGLDRDPAGAARLAGELAALKAAWGTENRRDPFHHPQLSRHSEHFVVQI